MDQREMILKRNLDEVEDRLAAACERSGRKRNEVELVVVTKYVSAEIVRILFELGVKTFGESRPQELWKKVAGIHSSRFWMLPSPAHGPVWHLVGHLQRNKIERTLPLVQMIHSVDRFRLLEALDSEAEKTNNPAHVLLEFNVSGEVSKHGFSPSDVPALPGACRRLRGVRVCGLMTMAPLDESPEASRPVFAGLRQLRDQLQKHVPPEQPFRHLSMGMTNDFEVAVEEGATIVRIGSALFKGVNG